MKFRKKPVVIDAWQWTGLTLSDAKLFTETAGLPPFSVGSFNGTSGLVIPTLEGVHVATRNDWIIKGVSGEFYPCKPDIFEATYEKVE